MICMRRITSRTPATRTVMRTSWTTSCRHDQGSRFILQDGSGLAPQRLVQMQRRHYLESTTEAQVRYSTVTSIPIFLFFFLLSIAFFYINIFYARYKYNNSDASIGLYPKRLHGQHRASLLCLRPGHFRGTRRFHTASVHYYGSDALRSTRQALTMVPGGQSLQTSRSAPGSGYSLRSP